MIINEIPPFWGWTSYTPVIPKLYWDVYSQEERIKRLCKEYDKLAHYSSEIASTVNDIDSTVKTELADTIAEVNASLKVLDENWTKILNEITETDVSWNVQFGKSTSSVEAMRDMFNDVSIHSITVEELNALDITVEGLADSTLSVRGLALIGYYLIDKSTINSSEINTNGLFYN